MPTGIVETSLDDITIISEDPTSPSLINILANLFQDAINALSDFTDSHLMDPPKLRLYYIRNSNTSEIHKTNCPELSKANKEHLLEVSIEQANNLREAKNQNGCFYCLPEWHYK